MKNVLFLTNLFSNSLAARAASLVSFDEPMLACPGISHQLASPHSCSQCATHARKHDTTLQKRLVDGVKDSRTPETPNMQLQIVGPISSSPVYDIVGDT